MQDQAPDPVKREPNALREPRLWIVFGVTLVAIMAVSSISPVLPTLAEVFDVSPERISWVITAFTLPGVFL
ncbi:MFS transporter, partial [bacterium]|nr:MFS transporter [bacterium]